MSDTVLILIDWYLPGYKAGGPVTSCANMIEAMRSRIRFKVLTRNTDYCEDTPYPNVVHNQWVLRDKNEQVMYLTQNSLTYRTIRQVIHQSAANVIYINGLYSLYFSIYPLLIVRHKALRNKKVIVASRGMLAKSAIGVKPLKKTLFLFMARALGLYRHVTFHATNQKEKEDILREIGSHAKVQIASNISRHNTNKAVNMRKEKGKLRLLSIARVAPEKNLWFLLNLLEGIADVHLELSIYGAVYDPEYWVSCKKLIDQFPPRIQVQYCGLAQPDDIPGIIQDHHALVLPSRGENYGHVVAESFMNSRPVIVSDQTPWRNLQSLYAGFDLSLNEPQSFRDAILTLANADNIEYEKWTTGADKLGQQIREDDKPRTAHIKMLTE